MAPVSGRLGNTSSRYAQLQPHALPDSFERLSQPATGLMVLPRHMDQGPYYEVDLADELLSCYIRGTLLLPA
ncbi:hypothetical protein AAIB46_14335 [Streptomyces sp. 35M1]|uniref:hypothetical protein n=1 Tax=Streptomyces sp. 35M1 TaxID=3142978 RepID=UPI003990D838